jgi:hypothetical protein
MWFALNLTDKRKVDGQLSKSGREVTRNLHQKLIFVCRRDLEKSPVGRECSQEDLVTLPLCSLHTRLVANGNRRTTSAPFTQKNQPVPGQHEGDTQCAEES